MVTAIITYIWWALAFVSIIGSIVLMRKVKSRVPEGSQDQSPLTSDEKRWVIITCLLSPLICQAIYYYGWKKRLPSKARSANKWGWLAILIVVIVRIGWGLVFVV